MFGFGKSYRKVAVGIIDLKHIGIGVREIPFTFEESRTDSKRRVVLADTVTHWQDEVEAFFPVYHWLQGGPLPREAILVPHV